MLHYIFMYYYNMSVRVVLYMNSRQEVVCLIQHGCKYCKGLLIRMDVNVRICRNDFREKIERKVYVNQQNFVSDIQLLIKHVFLLCFLHELLMFTNK